MNKLKLSLMAGLVAFGGIGIANAQISAVDSVMEHAGGSRLTVGGYGEVAYSRNFYSDNGYRLTRPASYKDDPSHGRFDIPHAVIYLGYDFGKGWTMGTEIEFEHGGSGSSIEYEAEEALEYENEVEKGGEVELEQFWLQKSFSKALNLRFGHIVVPFGLVNAHHEPLNFFTVYRPEGENTILPSTWHQTGASFFGRYKDFRYEAQFIAGLNALKFSRGNWIQGGVHSPFEFEPANRYGALVRIDNYSVPGLRMAVSGYYGQSFHNTTPNMYAKSMKSVKGNIYLGSFDFSFNRFNWIVRGNIDYGYVTDTKEIQALTYPNKTSRGVTPHEAEDKYFGSHAMASMVEVGYDVFSQIPKLRADNQKLYVFGHYEYYDSYIHTSTKKWTNKRIYAAGVNYFPIPEIAIKAEYNFRDLRSPYNNEPALNIGVAYEGFFNNLFSGKKQKRNKEIPEMQRRLDEMQQEINELRSRKPEVVEKVNNVYQDNNYVVTFAYDEDKLSDNDKSVLDKISQSAIVDIQAYASPEGSSDYNKKLSERRAETVKKYLEARGIKVSNASANGASDKYSNRLAIVTIK